MALTRTALREKGITEREILDYIMEEHGATVEAAKEKAKETTEHAMQKTINALQTQLDNAPKFTAEELQVKYDELKSKYDADIAAKDTAFAEYKTSVETREVLAKKQSIIMQQLESDGANPKLTKLLVKEFDLNKVQIDGDKVKDWDTISKPVKDGYADVFGTVKTESPKVDTPPKNIGGESKPADVNTRMNNIIRNKGETE